MLAVATEMPCKRNLRITTGDGRAWRTEKTQLVSRMTLPAVHNEEMITSRMREDLYLGAPSLKPQYHFVISVRRLPLQQVPEGLK